KNLAYKDPISPGCTCDLSQDAIIGGEPVCDRHLVSPSGARADSLLLLFSDSKWTYHKRVVPYTGRSKRVLAV
ncbi:hypothetical protein BGZ54_000697, partial [Gamsiella multidivaricata]